MLKALPGVVCVWVPLAVRSTDCDCDCGSASALGHTPGPGSKCTYIMSSSTSCHFSVIPLLFFSVCLLLQVYLAGARSPAANLDLLDQILATRHELARLLGHNSYAAFKAAADGSLAGL